MSTDRKIHWQAAEVQCPFFINESKPQKSVTCEGMSDAMRTHLVFTSLAAKDKHMGKYCVLHYERCPMYKFIYDLKYKEEC